MAKKFIPADDGRTTKTNHNAFSSSRYKSDSTFFHSPRHRRDFAVHPDWVSESLLPKTEQPYPLSVHKPTNSLPPPAVRGRSPTKRAKSANGQNRDPITWRAWYYTLYNLDMRIFCLVYFVLLLLGNADGTNYIIWSWFVYVLLLLLLDKRLGDPMCKYTKVYYIRI